MHLDRPYYGHPLQRVESIQVDDHYRRLAGHWLHDESYERDINRLGAYVHRFAHKTQQSQGSSHGSSQASGSTANFNMAEALDKLLNRRTPTPCTYVGPGFCRTYNHFLWEGCAGLIFSNRMRQVLTYKGDLDSMRLSKLNPRGIQAFLNAKTALHDAAQHYANYLAEQFNQLDATTSAFKQRRSKKLYLVTSARHLQAKCREIESRVEDYFRHSQYQSHFDTESKKIIVHALQLSAQDIPTMTKAELINQVQTLMQQNSNLHQRLAATLIKLQAFRDDAGIRSYLARCYLPNNKPEAQRRYVRYLEDQFNHPQPHQRADATTLISPNEVLGMPQPEDLLGFVLDSSTLRSFQQALQTHAHLHRQIDHRVRQMLSCFLHLPSHLRQRAVIQLGWSRHVLPWLPENLIKHARHEPIAAMHQPQYTEHPDLYRLIVRIAENSVVQGLPGYQVVAGMLRLKANLPLDIGHLRGLDGSGQEQALLTLAAFSELPLEAFQLLWYLASADAGAAAVEADILDRVKPRLKEATPHISSQRQRYKESALIKQKIDWLATHKGQSMEQKWQAFLPVLTTQLDRLLASPEDSQTGKHGLLAERDGRHGAHDQGLFRFNPKVQSIALRYGLRRLEWGGVQQGLFDFTDDLRTGGIRLGCGLEADALTGWQLRLPPSTAMPQVSIRAQTVSEPTPWGGSSCLTLHLAVLSLEAEIRFSPLEAMPGHRSARAQDAQQRWIQQQLRQRLSIAFDSTRGELLGLITLRHHGHAGCHEVRHLPFKPPADACQTYLASLQAPSSSNHAITPAQRISRGWAAFNLMKPAAATEAKPPPDAEPISLDAWLHIIPDASADQHNLHSRRAHTILSLLVLASGVQQALQSSRASTQAMLATLKLSEAPPAPIAAFVTQLDTTLGHIVNGLLQQATVAMQGLGNDLSRTVSGTQALAASEDLVLRHFILQLGGRAQQLISHFLHENPAAKQTFGFLSKLHQKIKVNLEQTCAPGCTIS